MTGAFRRNVSSGAPWEDIVGYSRAVRIGDRVVVSGTTAAGPDGAIVGVGDAARQTQAILATIETALAETGAGLADVVRTRIYVTDIALWPAVAAAHLDAFADVRPAATMVQVARLIHPDMLVEIEAEAVISAGRSVSGAA